MLLSVSLQNQEARAEESGLRCLASVGCLWGWGSAGELEARLEEMEITQPGGWLQSKGVTGREAGGTTRNVSDCTVSLDVQKVPTMWNRIVFTTNLLIGTIGGQSLWGGRRAEPLQDSRVLSTVKPKVNAMGSMPQVS